MAIGMPKGLADIIGPKPKEASEAEPDRMESAAQDLLAAISQDDPKGVADAFRAMFMAAESEPHDEAGDDE